MLGPNEELKLILLYLTVQSFSYSQRSLKTVFLYFFLLVIFAIMHQKEDAGVWRACTREFPWFATKQCIRSTPNSPMGARFVAPRSPSFSLPFGRLRSPRQIANGQAQSYAPPKPPSFAAPKPRRPPPVFVHQRAGLSSQVEIEHTGDDSQLTLRSGRSKFTLASLPVEDYPVMSGGDLPFTFTLAAEEMKGLIDRTRFAISILHPTFDAAEPYSQSHTAWGVYSTEWPSCAAHSRAEALELSKNRSSKSAAPRQRATHFCSGQPLLLSHSYSPPPSSHINTHYSLPLIARRYLCLTVRYLSHCNPPAVV